MEISSFENIAKQEIQKLFVQTFSDSEGAAEGAVIGELVLKIMTKTDPQDRLGFVATENDQIVGGIFFTKLIFELPVVAFLLSPVAVHSDHQGQKIGQQLINFGLERLREKDVELVFTYGDPNYYSQVGFEPISETLAKAPFELSQPHGWLCQSLNGQLIDALPGKSRCVEAFNDSALW